MGVMKFTGGETAAMARLKDYFWDKVEVTSLWAPLIRLLCVSVGPVL